MGTGRLNVTHCGPLCLGFSLLPAVFTSASGLCRPQLAIFSLLTDVFTSASSLRPPRAVDVEHYVYLRPLLRRQAEAVSVTTNQSDQEQSKRYDFQQIRVWRLSADTDEGK